MSTTPRTDNYRSQGREWIPLGTFERVERENSRLREVLEEITKVTEDTPVLTYQRMEKIAADALSSQRSPTPLF